MLTLITQFGGGKTHTLTTLYHLAKLGSVAQPNCRASQNSSAKPASLRALQRRKSASLSATPGTRRARPRNAVDRSRAATRRRERRRGARVSCEDHATGNRGDRAGLCRSRRPGAALFDEVLNFVNRHRGMADGFHAFIQNLTVARPARRKARAVISLPRSQVEMTEWDQQWQDRITKVVRRVAKDLIANDETEISEVVRRRLFEDLGDERIRKNVAKDVRGLVLRADRALAAGVDGRGFRSDGGQGAGLSSAAASRPAIRSTLRRSRSSNGNGRRCTQFQQTRGTLAMLAQWISWAAREHFERLAASP